MQRGKIHLIVIEMCAPYMVKYLRAKHYFSLLSGVEITDVFTGEYDIIIDVKKEIKDCVMWVCHIQLGFPL